MAEKTCCVTGHRDIPEDRIAYVEQELRREVLAAIQDGYTRFISGFAEGADLMFAAIVAEQKEHAPSCFLERNRYMAGESQRVIAVYDGRERGGTLFTMRYAHSIGREVREIRV